MNMDQQKLGMRVGLKSSTGENPNSSYRRRNLQLARCDPSARLLKVLFAAAIIGLVSAAHEGKKLLIQVHENMVPVAGKHAWHLCKGQKVRVRNGSTLGTGYPDFTLTANFVGGEDVIVNLKGDNGTLYSFQRKELVAVRRQVTVAEMESKLNTCVEEVYEEDDDQVDFKECIVECNADNSWDEMTLEVLAYYYRNGESAGSERYNLEFDIRATRKEAVQNKVWPPRAIFFRLTDKQPIHADQFEKEIILFNVNGVWDGDDWDNSYFWNAMTVFNGVKGFLNIPCPPCLEQLEGTDYKKLRFFAKATEVPPLPLERDLISAGMPVKVVIVNKTTEFNGQTGIVTQSDKAPGCWVVKLDQSGRLQAFKEDQLEIDNDKLADMITNSESD